LDTFERAGNGADKMAKGKQMAGSMPGSVAEAAIKFERQASDKKLAPVLSGTPRCCTLMYVCVRVFVCSIVAETAIKFE
jgi:hypothetical protein